MSYNGLLGYLSPSNPDDESAQAGGILGGLRNLNYGDILNQFSQGIGSQRNALAGLGLGLMAGSPFDRYGPALRGYQAGANSDSLDAYRKYQQQQGVEDRAYQRERDKISDQFRNRQFAASQQPSYQKTGEDEFGRPTYGWVNPANQSITPVGSQSQGGGAPPPGMDATVDAILQGRMAPPSSFAASKPYWQQILGMAAAKEPGFDLTQWGARFNTAKDFSAGAAAKNVTSLNTVMGHIDTLREKAEALDNSNFTPANQMKNTIQQIAGRPEVKEFQVARDAVADELAKVFRSTGMSEQQIQMWRSSLSEADSPAQLKGATKTALDLLASRQDALGDQYRRGFGKEPPELLNDKSKKALENVTKWITGAPSRGISGGSDSGGGPSEGSTATNPQTGQRIIFKGGQWQQM